VILKYNSFFIIKINLIAGNINYWGPRENVLRTEKNLLKAEKNMFVDMALKHSRISQSGIINLFAYLIVFKLFLLRTLGKFVEPPMKLKEKELVLIFLLNVQNSVHHF
jgi:hypothetical protein